MHVSSKLCWLPLAARGPSEVEAGSPDSIMGQGCSHKFTLVSMLSYCGPTLTRQGWGAGEREDVQTLTNVAVL